MNYSGVYIQDLGYRWVVKHLKSGLHYQITKCTEPKIEFYKMPYCIYLEDFNKMKEIVEEYIKKEIP